MLFEKTSKRASWQLCTLKNVVPEIPEEPPDTITIARASVQQRSHPPDLGKDDAMEKGKYWGGDRVKPKEIKHRSGHTLAGEGREEIWGYTMVPELP